MVLSPCSPHANAEQKEGERRRRLRAPLGASRFPFRSRSHERLGSLPPGDPRSLALRLPAGRRPAGRPGQEPWVGTLWVGTVVGPGVPGLRVRGAGTRRAPRRCRRGERHGGLRGAVARCCRDAVVVRRAGRQKPQPPRSVSRVPGRKAAWWPLPLWAVRIKEFCILV